MFPIKGIRYGDSSGTLGGVSVGGDQTISGGWLNDTIIGDDNTAYVNWPYLENRYATLLHGLTLLVIQTQEQDPMLFKAVIIDPGLAILNHPIACRDA